MSLGLPYSKSAIRCSSRWMPLDLPESRNISSSGGVAHQDICLNQQWYFITSQLFSPAPEILRCLGIFSKVIIPVPDFAASLCSARNSVLLGGAYTSRICGIQSLRAYETLDHPSMPESSKCNADPSQVFHIDGISFKRSFAVYSRNRIAVFLDGCCQRTISA